MVRHKHFREDPTKQIMEVGVSDNHEDSVCAQTQTMMTLNMQQLCR